MKKLLTAAIIFALLIIGISGRAILRNTRTGNQASELSVRLNELQYLIQQGDQDAALHCADEFNTALHQAEDHNNDSDILLMCGVCLLFLSGIVVYCSVTVVLPFRRMNDFAEHVARGELDYPLAYERTNLFGKFTWAFDSMRKEILQTRAREQEAIENNKTVIASISHDIKTPVASIRAYAEALELGMDGDPEKRAAYVATILRKCDEVSQLTDDMLTHALTELERLRFVPEPFDLGAALAACLEDCSAGRNDILFEKPSSPLYVCADRNRIAQMTENLVNNARKYAKTNISITLKQEDDRAVLLVRDYGPGIPDDELPFIFGKFYRGTNAKHEKGAGLGLYIVRYIAEQSGGSVRVQNAAPGLAVTVTLPLAHDTPEGS